MAQGSTFVSQDDYFDMTDELIATMCPCLITEFVDAIASAYPETYAWAMGFCRTGVEFIAAVALQHTGEFQWALSQLSKGCFRA